MMLTARQEKDNIEKKVRNKVMQSSDDKLKRFYLRNHSEVVGRNPYQ